MQGDGRQQKVAAMTLTVDLVSRFQSSFYMKFKDKRKGGLNNCKEKKSQLRNGNHENGNSRPKKYRNEMF